MNENGDTGPTEIEGKVGNSSLRVKSYRLIDMLIGVLVFTGAATLYLQYEHKADMKQAIAETNATDKESAKAIADAIKEQSKSIENQTRAINFQSCMTSLPIEKRGEAYANDYHYCNKLGRF